MTDRIQKTGKTSTEWGEKGIKRESLEYSAHGTPNPQKRKERIRRHTTQKKKGINSCCQRETPRPTAKFSSVEKREKHVRTRQGGDPKARIDMKPEESRKGKQQLKKGNGNHFTPRPRGEKQYAERSVTRKPVGIKRRGREKEPDVQNGGEAKKVLRKKTEAANRRTLGEGTDISISKGEEKIESSGRELGVETANKEGTLPAGEEANAIKGGWVGRGARKKRKLLLETEACLKGIRTLLLGVLFPVKNGTLCGTGGDNTKKLTFKFRDERPLGKTAVENRKRRRKTAFPGGGGISKNASLREGQWREASSTQKRNGLSVREQRWVAWRKEGSSAGKNKSISNDRS